MVNSCGCSAYGTRNPAGCVQVVDTQLPSNSSMGVHLAGVNNVEIEWWNGWFNFSSTHTDVNGCWLSLPIPISDSLTAELFVYHRFACYKVTAKTMPCKPFLPTQGPKKCGQGRPFLQFFQCRQTPVDNPSKTVENLAFFHAAACGRE